MVVNGTCLECSKQFERKIRYKAYKPKFCSHQCVRQWQRTNYSGEKSPLWKGRFIRLCRICKKSMKLAAWQMKNNIRYNKIYCSMKCKNIGQSFVLSGANSPHWKGGSSDQIQRNGIGWTPTFRRLIHEKNGNKCIFCHAEKLLAIHHKDFNPKNNKPENLISICKFCHATYHGLVKSYFSRINYMPK